MFDVPYEEIGNGHEQEDFQPSQALQRIGDSTKGMNQQKSEPNRNSYTLSGRSNSSVVLSRK